MPPGRYFSMHLVGYFEGIGSERGLEWRCSDSLSLREFLRLENDRIELEAFRLAHCQDLKIFIPGRWFRTPLPQLLKQLRIVGTVASSIDRLEKFEEIIGEPKVRRIGDRRRSPNLEPD